jgi:hypothetical protein
MAAVLPGAPATGDQWKKRIRRRTGLALELLGSTHYLRKCRRKDNGDGKMRKKK